MISFRTWNVCEREQEKFEEELDRRKRMLDAFVRNHEMNITEFRKIIAELVSSTSE